MDFNMKPWWRTDTYDHEDPTRPLASAEVWGPKGPALVQLYDDGRTGPGWGRDTFMDKYMKNHFAMNRVLHGYAKGKHHFAWVMRSAKVVCIDIDGKNGGLEHATELGFLPPTVAETSKSGNGYHLFYEVEDEWDDADGFGAYRDHIGLVTGVDIRSVGCVYHYPTQRWNNRELANMPAHLSELLLAKARQREQTKTSITKVLELDKEDIAIMQYELLEELAKPIPAGKRNNTLFAIGSKLKLAEVENWDEALRARGEEVGLDADEIEKIVSNVETYA